MYRLKVTMSEVCCHLTNTLLLLQGFLKNKIFDFFPVEDGNRVS
jgi:hypothetical protein